MAEKPNKKGDAMSGHEVKPSRRVLADFLGLDIEEISDTSKLSELVKLAKLDEEDPPITVESVFEQVWGGIEEEQGVLIPKSMRLSNSDLLERTAEQFDNVVIALTSEPDKDDEAGELEQKILDSSEEIPSKYS